ncbi:hypothetical protein ABPG74_020149 [Tetrahymena malaccensis]
MEKILKWRQIVKIFIDISQFHSRERYFQFIEEKDLLTQDSLIFSIEKHIQSLKALNEQLRIQHLKKIHESEANLSKNNIKTIPPKPQKPEEPDQDDCCGSGCQVCVFDRYYQKLEEYEEKLMEWEEKYGDLFNDEEESSNQNNDNDPQNQQQKS